MERLLGWALTTPASAFIGSFLAGYLRRNGGQPDLRDLFALRVEANRAGQAGPISRVRAGV
jgi:hypothetical protein